MNIKDLENFHQVSQYKSFSFAAKMMEVSQPTLSESIKRLESHIGSLLFYRSKAGIKLTPSGEQILIKTKDLLNLKNQIIAVSDKSSSLSQSFKLGFHATIGGYFFNEFLINVHKSYPNIIFNLEHNRSQIIQNHIQDGHIDIGIVVNPINNPDLIIKKICEDRIYIWESNKHKVLKQQVIADTGLIQVQSILRKWKKAPGQCISTSDFHLIGEMIESGLGYGVLPERFVNQRKLKLKKVHPNHFFKDTFALVYRPEFGKSPAEKFVIECLNNSFS